MLETQRHAFNTRRQPVSRGSLAHARNDYAGDNSKRRDQASPVRLASLNLRPHMRIVLARQSCAGNFCRIFTMFAEVKGNLRAGMTSFAKAALTIRAGQSENDR